MIERLTPAERRTLDVMRTAESEEDAARLMGVSRHTVHSYLRNVRSKLGVRTTRQAITKVDAHA